VGSVVPRAAAIDGLRGGAHISPPRREEVAYLRESRMDVDSGIADRVSMVLAQNVLVVDDDSDVRSSSAEILRTAGYVVYEAADGYAAVEHLRVRDISAVLLDVNMPGLDGLSLLDQFDHLPPVALLTEHEYDPEVIARRAKLSMYLSKPVPPRDLIEAVSHMLTASNIGSLGPRCIPLSPA
jgi:two-component system, chemotaxis family, chemotaxis protein CheY